MPNALALHPHERARLLAHGRGPLLRPVEPQPERRGEIHLVSAYYWRCDRLDAGYCHTSELALKRLMQRYCPLGRPGDTLLTDAGPVRVVGVRVARCREVTVTDALDAGGLALPNRPTYEAEKLAAVNAWREAGRPSEAPRPPLGDGPLQRVRRWWSEAFPAYPWEAAWCWLVEVENA